MTEPEKDDFMADVMREKIDLRTVCLRILYQISFIYTRAKYSLREKDDHYNRLVMRLSEILYPYRDREHEEALKKLEGTTHEGNAYTRRLFMELNDLMRRLGMGLDTEGEEEV